MENEKDIVAALAAQICIVCVSKKKCTLGVLYNNAKKEKNYMVHHLFNGVNLY